MQQIIVEDGSVVADANSYVSLAELRQLMDSYSIIPAEVTDDQLTRILFRAMRYIDAMNFKGEKVNPFHTTEWPRSDVAWAPYTLWPSDKVPPQVKQALALLVSGVVNEGEEVLTPAQNIRREKVGQLEIEFYASGGIGGESVWQKQAVDLLLPFCSFMKSTRV